MENKGNLCCILYYYLGLEVLLGTNKFDLTYRLLESLGLKRSYCLTLSLIRTKFAQTSNKRQSCLQEKQSWWKVYQSVGNGCQIFAIHDIYEFHA